MDRPGKGSNKNRVDDEEEVGGVEIGPLLVLLILEVVRVEIR